VKDHAIFTHWPQITIQIPIFNEGHLITGTIEALRNLEYDKDKMLIQILDDSTDQETLTLEQETMMQMRELGFNITLIHRQDRAGYKAGALNHGLSVVSGEYIVVIDADTILPHDFLRQLIPQFNSNPRLAFIQARCQYYNRWYSWTTSANAIVRDIHFLIEQPARNSGNLLPNFSGKAGVWRREVVEQYGWNEQSLTEDIDLSYRVQIDGWQGKYFAGSTCEVELPPNISQFKGQQKRWNAGFAQVFRRLWRKILTSKHINLRQKTETLVFLSSSLIHPIALLSVGLWIIAAILEPTTTLAFWLSSRFASMLMLFLSAGPLFSTLAAISLSDGRKERVRKILTIPLTIILLSSSLWSNAYGTVQGLLRDNLVFETTKKLGISTITKQAERRTRTRLQQRIVRNKIELFSSGIVFVTVSIILLRGQIASAIPLIFVASSWLLNVFQE
jgi:cellulose synthase/poly-beta-1,6-N-acetylglucosamine synthase-like glycosyltransferase